jgi:hypothetical protein
MDISFPQRRLKEERNRTRSRHAGGQRLIELALISLRVSCFKEHGNITIPPHRAVEWGFMAKHARQSKPLTKRGGLRISRCVDNRHVRFSGHRFAQRGGVQETSSSDMSPEHFYLAELKSPGSPDGARGGLALASVRGASGGRAAPTLNCAKTGVYRARSDTRGAPGLSGVEVAVPARLTERKARGSLAPPGFLPPGPLKWVEHTIRKIICRGVQRDICEHLQAKGEQAHSAQRDSMPEQGVP